MITITPNKSDILLGRGGKNNKNEGNKLLRHLSKKHASFYARSSKAKKAAIIDSLLTQIYSSKPEIRFLFQNKDSGEWELATKCTSREKVSQGLRDAARKRNKDRNLNSFSVEFHSGSQGLPGYYEEEDCYVIGSFKSYNKSQLDHDEEFYEPYSTSIGAQVPHLSQKNKTEKGDVCHKLIDHKPIWEQPLDSKRDGCRITSHNASSHQPHHQSYHHTSNYVSPASSEYPTSPSSQSTISSYNDNHFSKENQHINLTHQDRTQNRNQCINLTTQERTETSRHQRKRSSTYISSEQEILCEESQHAKRMKYVNEMEPFPFRQNAEEIVENIDDSSYSSDQDEIQTELIYEDLQIFDWI